MKELNFTIFMQEESFVPIRFIPMAKLPQCETVAVGLYADDKAAPPGLPKAWAEEIRRLRKLGDITGRLEEVSVLYPAGQGTSRLLLCGLGEQAKADPHRLRRVAGRAVKKAQALKAKELTWLVDSFAGPMIKPIDAVQALTGTGILAQYQYRECKTQLPAEEQTYAVRLALAGSKTQGWQPAARTAEIVAESANYARTLANRPGNRLLPADLAQAARALGRAFPKLKATVRNFAQLKRAGCGALAAVGQGSAHPPVLIELRYLAGRKNARPIALAGKGITFDSGGIDIKPAANMENMKFDMSGAAAVLGIFRAAAALRLPVNLVGVVPAAENLPSGSAARPGDVVTSLSGQTIEILNTDAEGRLVLADALTYVLRYKPAYIVDIATLTGAVVMALGHAAMAVLGNQETLVAELGLAGERSGERAWPLPLWDEYRELLKSEVADVPNMGSKPGAGTIVGAAFLEKFVGGTPWAHLDIAGTAYGEAGPIYAKGATGAGVRLVMEWLLEKARK